MRVLHIVKTARGAAWVYQQVRVLRDAGLEIVVAIPGAKDGMGPQYQALGVRVVPLDLDFPARRPWEIPAVLAACRKLVREIQPDLIHAHHVGTAFVVRAALGRHAAIPRIFQVPGTLHLEHRAIAALDLGLAGAEDYWIASSEWTYRKYMELGLGRERVFLSYAGTDVKPFSGIRSGRLRQELRVPAGAPLAGMVAYMYAPRAWLGQERGIKGHEDFFAALALAREARPDIHGVIVGGAWNRARWYEERLRYLGQRHCNGYLRFAGFREDVAAIYPDLDVAVAPSLSENVGGAVEPLLSGVPVVATNVGGLPDLIKDGDRDDRDQGGVRDGAQDGGGNAESNVDDRATGWLAPPGNAPRLAQAIVEALDNPEEARRRTAAGQALARKLFDVERTGREVAEIYSKILARSPQISKDDCGVESAYERVTRR